MEIPSSSDVLAPLREIAELHESPADQRLWADSISEFDGFLTPLTVRTVGEMLEKADRLRFIATASTGTDHIAVADARRRGIAVICLKNETEFLSRITATAELAWALLLSVARHIPEAVASARAGVWARDVYRGHQLSGKTLGIVGYGRLGRIIADYGKGFRMRVLACDTRPLTPAEGVDLVDFHTLLAHSDAVTIHIHLTEENRNLFSREVFGRMKRGALLINTSRGAIIDEAALIEALDSGQLAGAGLDVIHGEWSDNLVDHPLLLYSRHHPNLVITPHIGGITYESQRMAYERIVSMVVDFIKTQWDGKES